MGESHLLFWLSLIPFATGWMGENTFARCRPPSMALLLFMPAIAYYILQLTIIQSEGRTCRLGAGAREGF